MKAVTKARILVGIVTIAVFLVMVVPGLSILFKDGTVGLNMEVGCDSVFEVDGETPVFSIQMNLDSSKDKGATVVTYDGITKTLSSNNSALAETISDYAASKGQPMTVKATDPAGNTVKLDTLDVSTADEQITLVRITTSPMATKTIKPNLSLEFVNDGFVAKTNTSMSIENGVMDCRIAVPQTLFITAQMMGCSMVLHMDIDYVKMMNIKMSIDMGVLSGAETTVTISGGTETIAVDLSDSEDADTYLGYVDDLPTTGTTVNGIPLTIVVDKTAKSVTITTDVDDSSLSQMLRDSLEAHDGCIILSTGDPDQTVTVPADQVDDIIALIASMEGSA